MDADVIRLTVHTRPIGQERAGRVLRSDSTGRVRMHAYTPSRTRAAVNAIRAEWMAAGRPRVPEATPFRIIVEAILRRPASHTRKDGSPASVWVEMPSRPDVDNVLKLVLDALQPDCFANDSWCREATAAKRYGTDDKIEVTLDWS